MSVHLKGSLSLVNTTNIYLKANNTLSEVTDGWLRYNGDNNLHKFWGLNKFKHIYSLIYPNANVYSAGAVSVNNGNRSPVTKTGNGDSVVFCVRNGSGSEYGGNWMDTVCIALTPEAALLTAPNIGSGTVPYTIEGVTYYVSGQGSNASWGGATTISSPIGVPIFDDWFMWQPNYNMEQSVLIEILQRLKIYPYYRVIPIMSSNTTPYGTVITDYFVGYDGSYRSTNEAYYVFNGNSSNHIEIGTENAYGEIEYDFDSSVAFESIVVRACKIRMSSANPRNESLSVYVYDGSWNLYGTINITEDHGMNYTFKDYIIRNSVSNITKIKVVNNNQKTYGYNIAIESIQAY